MSNRPLYLILEISADATPEEVKRAYHMQALRYHPDKAGPEGAEKFQQVLAAYTLLSDPEARQMYDKYGEQGLSNMEAMPAMADAAQYMDKVSFFRLMFGMGSLLSIVTVAFFAVLSVKLDRKTDISWHAVFTPGYTLLFFAVTTVLISIIFRIRKYRNMYRTRYDAVETDADEMQNYDRKAPSAGEVLKSLGYAVIVREIQFWISHFLILGVSGTLLLVTISFAQRENPESSPIGWWAVYSPAIAGNVVSFASVPVFRSILRAKGIHDISTYFLVTLNIISVLIAAFRTLQIVLIFLLFEEILVLDAEICTLPAQLYFFTSFAYEALIAIQRTRAIRKIDRETPYMSEEEKEVKLAKSRSTVWSMWAEIGFWLYVNTLAISGLIFTARAKLYGGYSVAFIPFFVLFGTLFLASLFLFVCFTIFIETDAMEKREKEKQEKARQQREAEETQEEYGEYDPADEHSVGDAPPSHHLDSDPNKPNSPCTGQMFCEARTHKRNFEEL